METGCGSHDAAHVLLAEGWCGVRATQRVEERNRETRNLGGAVRARIRGASSGSQPRHRGEREALALGQTVAPIVPEAGLAERELAISFDALRALAMNDFLPNVVRVGELVLRGFVGGNVFGDDIFQQRGEDIEIVNFAEEIL
jgi:hypothetical protein